MGAGEALIFWLVMLGGFAFVAVVVIAARTLVVRQRGRDRLYAETPASVEPEQTEPEPDFLTNWLGVAGFRSAGAVNVFLALTALALVAGLMVPFVFRVAGTTDRLLRGLVVIPGGVGDLFLPVVHAGPWFLFVIIAGLPWLFVRRARRWRVQLFEQDLTIYLELFATLSEAGLGFDAALERILRSQPPGRPLADEFRTFQVELLAGRPRVHCLRRLARRVDLTTLTAFVSALVQAEQVGGGVASVLRRQADDLRDRRREQFLAQAMTLPVKLAFPLIICFMPGLFIFTLGPVFYQFFQFADGLMRNRGVLP
jgi:tight adherence protein C